MNSLNLDNLSECERIAAIESWIKQIMACRAMLENARAEANQESIARYFSDMGADIEAACCNLAYDPTTKRCDNLLARLQAAGHAVSRLRRMLVEGSQ